MLVAMGGGGGSTSNSSPSPPSPEQLQGKVNSAQTTVNQDQSFATVSAERTVAVRGSSGDPGELQRPADVEPGG